MGKKRSFLGFLATIYLVFATANALAAGYTCPALKKYTSCETGYYMTSTSVGNACKTCPTNAFKCPGGTDAPIYEITIKNGSSALAQIYYSASAGGFCDSETCKSGSTTITKIALTNLSGQSGKILSGFTGADSIDKINSDGTILAQSVSNNQPWTAKWTDCPAGSYCDGTTPTEEKACPNGLTSVAGAKNINDCFLTVQLNIPNSSHTITEAELSDNPDSTCELMTDASNTMRVYYGEPCYLPNLSGKTTKNTTTQYTTTAYWNLGNDQVSNQGQFSRITPITNADDDTVIQFDNPDATYQITNNGIFTLELSNVQQITCDPGTYLPAGANACANCNADVIKSSALYCPGNKPLYYNSDKNQGFADCKNLSGAPTTNKGIEGKYSVEVADQTTAEQCRFKVSDTTKSSDTTDGACSFTGNTVSYTSGAWGTKFYTPQEQPGYKGSANGATLTCEANKATIIYNPNGATSGEPSTTSQTCYYGQECKLATQGTMLKDGYLFYGWDLNSDNDSTSDYDPDANIRDELLTLLANGDTTIELNAVWAPHLFTCENGKDSNRATCKSGYYCPGGDVPYGTKDGDEGCQKPCPTDTNGGVLSSQSGADAISACKTTRNDVNLINDNTVTGTGTIECEYNKSTQQYDQDCNTTVNTCEAGYYYDADRNRAYCIKTNKGYYSPANDKSQHSCTGLPGANENTTTSDYGSVITECFNTCDVIRDDDAHMTQTPKSFEIYADGNGEISACEYTTECDAGYNNNDDINTCTNNKITVGLDDDGDNQADTTIYLLYDKGWYNDSDLTEGISSINLPTLNDKTCYGYKYNETEIINEDGQLIHKTFVTEGDVIISAVWDNKPTVTCLKGEYYPGTGDKCLTCPDDNYCSGGSSYQDEGIAGIEECPNDGSTDGEGKSQITECYKEYITGNIDDTGTEFNIKNGNGTKKCYFASTIASTGTYTDCEITVTACDAGSYVSDNNPDECTHVDSGQYSPANDMERYYCPTNGEYEVGSNTPRGEKTDCYTRCDSRIPDVSHSQTVSAVPETQPSNNMGKYEACQYNVTCQTGYDNTNGTTPTCTAHEYTITLDKNGGQGTTPDSINCVFDSATCQLPATNTLTKQGYKPVAQWCTTPDGTGTCYEAGTNIEQNISANATNVTLYAQWTPGIFKINLSTDQTPDNNAQGPVYLKYETGWYADPDAKTELTNIKELNSQLPELAGYVFGGYKINNITIINANGEFALNESALTAVSSDDQVATAIWGEGTITCPKGTYYPGAGSECQTCTKDWYCNTETTVPTDSGEKAGRTQCPQNGVTENTGTISATSCYQNNADCSASIDNAKTATGLCYYSVDTANYTSCRPESCIVTECDTNYTVAQDGKSCVYNTTSCPENSYCNETGKYDCPPTHPYSAAGNTSIDNCYKITDLQCTKLDTCPENGTCSYDENAVFENEGLQYYNDNKTVPLNEPKPCPINELTCNAGYINISDKNSETCTAGIYKITLDNNDNTDGTPSIIYQKYLDGLYSDAGATQQITNITLPVRDNHTFAGYFTTPNALSNYQKVIDENGNLLDGTPLKKAEYTGDTTLYAWWTQVSVSCEPGKYYNGNNQQDCEKNTYCDGTGNTDVLISGCFTQCPNDGSTDGTGKKAITDCFKIYKEGDTDSTGQIFDVPDGNGTKTCYFEGSLDQGAYTKCTTTVTACAAGYYLSDSKCDPVGKGYYSTNNTERTQCPTDAETGTPGTTETDTPASIDECYTANKSCTSNDIAGTQTCYYDADTGTYSRNCTVCSISNCPAGTYLDNNNCISCPADSYCTGGNTPAVSCADAGDRYTQADTNATNINACYDNCQNSDISNATSVTGIIYRDGSNNCQATACAEKYYLNNDGTCSMCEAGNFCEPGKAPQTCPQGYTSDSGTTSKYDCYKTCEPIDNAQEQTERDHYNDENKNNCVAISCNKGYYLDNGKCTKCPDGSNCNETGTVISCEYDYELINGICQPCNREHAQSYKTNGNCVIETCTTGYHPNGQTCETDNKSCSAPNAKSATQTWNATTKVFGACIIEQCTDGYHLADNICQTNTESCKLDNGIGTRTWNTKSNKWGACIVNKCNPGYEMKNNDCTECGNMRDDQGNIAVSTYIQGCEIGACMYQGELYTLNKKTEKCILICEEEQDDTGRRQWNPNTGRCEHTCNPGYTPWSDAHGS